MPQARYRPRPVSSRGVAPSSPIMPSTACRLTFSSLAASGTEISGLDRSRSTNAGSREVERRFELHAQDLPRQREPVQILVPAVRRGRDAVQEPGDAGAGVVDMRPPGWGRAHPDVQGRHVVAGLAARLKQGADQQRPDPARVLEGARSGARHQRRSRRPTRVGACPSLSPAPAIRPNAPLHPSRGRTRARCARAPKPQGLRYPVLAPAHGVEPAGG